MEQERFIKSFDGTSLYTSSIGSGLPLVLCDGLGCDGFIWRYIIDAYKDKCRIIRWNYRGHGLSHAPADEGAIGMPALRGDLRAVLDAYQVDKAVLFGHSLGVQVILDFALENQSRVLGLVPLCGSYGRPLDTFHGDARMGQLFPYIRDAVLRFPRLGQTFWRLLLGSEAAYRFATTFEVNGKVIKKGDFWPYFEHLAGMDATVFVRLLDRVREHTVEDVLSELKVPTLIVAAEYDTFTPLWLSQRMHKLIADSELLIIPGGSHVAPIEIPELLHLRLDKFLRERGLLKDHLSPHGNRS